MTETKVFLDRLERVRAAMAAAGTEALLLSVGADLPWLCGYEAMPLERLTMLVVPVDAPATLVIPGLEAPRVTERPELFSLAPWGETTDPTALVADLLGSRTNVGFGDRTWARFLIELLGHKPSLQVTKATAITGPLRARKDPAEIEALRRAGAAADRVATALQGGEIRLVGRTEADVSAELGRRLIAEGHQKVNFAIVAAGENAASPHHHAGSRVIRAGEVVLCDFGGTMDGYCSDITRCVHVGEPPAEFAELYDVLFASQAAGVAAAQVGTPCEGIDAAGRAVIDGAGYGEFFVHRIGHGIGLEEHEDPYMVSGNTELLAAGHAFSVEPGIYVPGRWGARLEDIVVATADGPDALNVVDHHLAIVDG